MMIDNLFSLGLVLSFLGTVDQVVGEIASVELSGISLAEPIQLDVPVLLFPCEVEEGDQFYATVVDGVTEIRCGEPPE